MGKKSENYNLKPAELVLQILYEDLIYRRRPVRLSFLSDKFGCSRQTIRRAMQIMETSFKGDLIVNGVEAKNGGVIYHDDEDVTYQLKRKFKDLCIDRLKNFKTESRLQGLRIILK